MNTRYGQQRKYNDKLVISVDPAKATFDLNGGVATKNTSISVDTILDALVFCEGAEVILDTRAKNEDFADILSDYQIHVNIVEVA